MPTVSVDVKNRIRLKELRLAPAEMQPVADTGVEAVRQRTAAGVGAADAPAAPLVPRYAKQKSNRGLAPRRDLRFTGRMMAGLRGTGRDNAAVIEVAEADRAKARANQQREPWLVFSPSNVATVSAAAWRSVAEAVKRIIRKV